MIRLAGGVVAGFVVFNLFVFLIARSAGFVWPAFDAVENPHDYTMAMLWFRLGLGAVGVFLSGMTAALISRRGAFAGLVMGVVFEVFFIPLHLLVLFNDFPIWYHATFLIYLIPVTWLGARLIGAGARHAQAA
jgi:hypothetical protein